jgi:GNAT superfamily N-acetyltransferase
VPYILRPLDVGDMGRIVHRQGLLYVRENRWDETFEALVAKIIADFVQDFDAKRERCWIAERDGAIVGSVFVVVRETGELAKLRLLYVEPGARGLGLGARLVDECIRFARLAGYRRITFWTNYVLTSVRRIYEAARFKLMDEKPHGRFGHDLIGQNWEREV